PTLIEVRTTIGYGSPNRAGKSKAHGEPLGADELKLTKEAYNWTFENDFHVPNEVYTHFEETVQKTGAESEQEWNNLFSSYKESNQELGKQLEMAINGTLPDGWEKSLPVYEVGKKLATRASSGETLNAIAQSVPQFFGGSADLAGSNKTMINGASDFMPHDYSGRNIWFGVREFAMGAALNGMALHGGLK